MQASATQSTEIIEAVLRLQAAELILCHAAVSADVFTVEQCVEHAITLLVQARRFLDVAEWAA